MQKFLTTLVLLMLLYIISVVRGQYSDALVHCKKQQKAREGQTSESNENLSYIWTKGSSGISLLDEPEMKSRILVTENGALLINRFQNVDHGTYVCTVKNREKIIEKISIEVNNSFILKKEACHPSKCIAASRCDSPSNLMCPDQGEVCCNTVKEEHKSLCRHFLGECMPTCNLRLRALRASDCQTGTMCCVLV